MFARFDEKSSNDSELLRKQSVTDGRTDARTDGRTDNVKTVYPLQTKFAGGIINGKEENACNTYSIVQKTTV